MANYFATREYIRHDDRRQGQFSIARGVRPADGSVRSAGMDRLVYYLAHMAADTQQILTLFLFFLGVALCFVRWPKADCRGRCGSDSRLPAFLTTLVVAFVVVSAMADRGASAQRVATGTVAEVHIGNWMLVANGHMRLPVAFGATTAYEGNPAVIKTGIRVTVWYRGVGERRLVADRVRVLPDATSP
jgi:hypothetical protein